MVDAVFDLGVASNFTSPSLSLQGILQMIVLERLDGLRDRD